VRGPEAAAFLERMVSNAVEELPPGGSCEALLLTPKARVVAPMTVLRRSPDDYLLLTEPDLGIVLRDTLLRARFAARCAIELEEHTSTLVLGQEDGGVPNRDYGVAAVELLDETAPRGAQVVSAEELERLRILARTPRFGAELDERVLPAEAGLDERAISFTKGCYPGQEPVARLHYRGRANRSLRVLALDGGTLPSYDTELTLAGKPVGRVTSVASDAEHGAVALAYVRREVSDDDVLVWDGGTARQIGPDTSGLHGAT
jgi:tRNA-modifying protein YgfZ